MGKKTSDALRAAGIKGTGSGKKSGGEKKYGRERKHAASARYTASRRWEENQLRRVRRHARRLPADRQAREWLAKHNDAAFLAALPKE